MESIFSFTIPSDSCGSTASGQTYSVSGVPESTKRQVPHNKQKKIEIGISVATKCSKSLNWAFSKNMQQKMLKPNDGRTTTSTQTNGIIPSEKFSALKHSKEVITLKMDVILLSCNGMAATHFNQSSQTLFFGGWGVLRDKNGKSQLQSRQQGQWEVLGGGRWRVGH